MSLETPSQPSLFISSSNSSSVKKEPIESQNNIKTIDISLESGDFEEGMDAAPSIDKSRLAPMLRQYVEIKETYPGYLLLFQVGIFLRYSLMTP
jgi:hypothetical protein